MEGLLLCPPSSPCRLLPKLRLSLTPGCISSPFIYIGLSVLSVSDTKAAQSQQASKKTLSAEVSQPHHFVTDFTNSIFLTLFFNRRECLSAWGKIVIKGQIGFLSEDLYHILTCLAQLCLEWSGGGGQQETFPLFCLLFIYDFENALWP